LKSIESRSGKRKPIVTENQVVVEEDKKFGGKDNMNFNNERSSVSKMLKRVLY